MEEEEVKEGEVEEGKVDEEELEGSNHLISLLFQCSALMN